MRTASEVQVEIEATRTLLLAADLAEDWTLGDRLLAELGDLWTEYGRIPHQRLPSDRDGHTAPRPV